MVGYPPLRIVIGANPFGTVTGTDLQLAAFGIFFVNGRFLQVIQLGPQVVHRLFLIFILRTVVLTLYDNPGGNMRNANGGFRPVNVLSAGSRGAVNVNFQISRIDVHINFFNLGQNGYGSGRRVHPPLRFRYRHSLYTVCAGLKF